MSTAYFNTRKYHFADATKHQQMQEFGLKYGLNEFLIPELLQKIYEHYVGY